MQWMIDGDQVVVVPDSFVNLQESPAVFVPANSDVGRMIQESGIRSLSFKNVMAITKLLLEGGGEYGNQ